MSGEEPIVTVPPVELGPDTAPRGLRGWSATAAVTLATGGALAVAATTSGGPSAIAGVVAAVAVVVTLAGLGGGVRLSLTISPGTAFATALSTYLLQVLLGVVLWVSTREGGALRGVFDPEWLGYSLVALVLAMTAGIVVDLVRAGRRAERATSESGPAVAGSADAREGC